MYKNFFAKIIIIVFFALLFSGCIKNPKICYIKPYDIKIKLSAMKIELKIGVCIRNENLFDIKFNNINAQIYLNNNFLTEIKDTNTYILKKHQNNIIEIPVTLNYTEISNNISSFLNLILGEETKFQVTGTSDYQVFFVNKNLKFNYITKL